jgi:hypothetical protein
MHYMHVCVHVSRHQLVVMLLLLAVLAVLLLVLACQLMVHTFIGWLVFPHSCACMGPWLLGM